MLRQPSGMAAGYSRAAPTATTLRKFVCLGSGAADGAVEHRRVIDRSDRLIAAIGIAARDHQHEFVVSTKASQRDRLKRAKRIACRVAARVGLGLGAAGLAFGGDQRLQPAR